MEPISPSDARGDAPEPAPRLFRAARLPAPVRFFRFTHRAAATIARLEALLHEEILWAWFGPARRDEINRALYAARGDYRPGGKYYAGGLFEWEERAVRSPSFPSRGRLLIGGAGAGREARALSDMGFTILAFDPCPPLVEAARERFRENSRVRFVEASYADFIRAVNGRAGPLAAHLSGVSFDGAILGWGSFSHSTDPAERRALLAALGRLAPNAPVLLSFLTPSALPAGKIDRLRSPLRRLLRFCGAPSQAGPGDTFLPEGGFVHLSDSEEIAKLARQAGYEIVQGGASPYPHALLARRT